MMFVISFIKAGGQSEWKNVKQLNPYLIRLQSRIANPSTVRQNTVRKFRNDSRTDEFLLIIRP